MATAVRVGVVTNGTGGVLLHSTLLMAQVTGRGFYRSVSVSAMRMVRALDRVSPLGSVLNGLPCEALVRVAEALRFWNSLLGKVSCGHPTVAVTSQAYLFVNQFFRRTAFSCEWHSI